MTGYLRFVAILLFFCLAFSVSPAQKLAKSYEIVPPRSYRPLATENSQELQTILNTAVGETVNSFLSKGFKLDEIAATLIDLRDPNTLSMAEVRGGQRIYPASVVKMFYMSAL